VEGVVLVSDEAIQHAQQAVGATLWVVAEPGGAAAFAALLSGRYRPFIGPVLGHLSFEFKILNPSLIELPNAAS
jgi:threonine dehydratase